jgi:hypothetical protein
MSEPALAAPPPPAAAPPPARSAPAPGGGARLSGRPLLLLISGAVAALWTVLGLVSILLSFSGGESIAGSGQAFLIILTILFLLGAAGFSALLILLAVRATAVPAPFRSTRMLALIGLGVGGLITGEAFYGLTLDTRAGAGAGAWLLLFSGLFLLGAAVVLLIAGDAPPLGPPSWTVVWLVAGAAGGALLVAIGSGLTWYSQGRFSVSGLRVDAGDAALAFAIVTILAAAVPVVARLAGWGRVGRIGVWSVVGLAALLAGLMITALTAVDISRGVGLVLGLIGALAALGLAVTAAVLMTREAGRPAPAGWA